MVFHDPLAQLGLERALQCDWRLEASRAWRAMSRLGACVDTIALNGFGAKLGHETDAMLVLVLGADACAASPDPERVLYWRKLFNLDAQELKLAEALARGEGALDIAVAQRLTPDGIERRIGALCAHLNVASEAQARALLACSRYLTNGLLDGCKIIQDTQRRSPLR